MSVYVDHLLHTPHMDVPACVCQVVFGGGFKIVFEFQNPTAFIVKAVGWSDSSATVPSPNQKRHGFSLN